MSGPGAYTVVDLAAKIINKYLDVNVPVDTGGGTTVDELQRSQAVMEQYIQSACGCGGGSTQGLKLTYTYFGYGADANNDGMRDDFTETIAEYRKDTSSNTGDMEIASQTALRHDRDRAEADAHISRALRLRSSTARGSRVGFGRASSSMTGTSRRTRAGVTMLFVATPSAVSGYTPVQGSPAGHIRPIVTLNATNGLAYGYEYDTESGNANPHRRTHARGSVAACR